MDGEIHEIDLNWIALDMLVFFVTLIFGSFRIVSWTLKAMPIPCYTLAIFNFFRHFSAPTLAVDLEWATKISRARKRSLPTPLCLHFRMEWEREREKRRRSEPRWGREKYSKAFQSSWRENDSRCCSCMTTARAGHSRPFFSLILIVFCSWIGFLSVLVYVAAVASGRHRNRIQS